MVLPLAHATYVANRMLFLLNLSGLLCRRCNHGKPLTTAAAESTPSCKSTKMWGGGAGSTEDVTHGEAEGGMFRSSNCFARQASVPGANLLSASRLHCRQKRPTARPSIDRPKKVHAAGAEVPRHFVPVTQLC